MEWDCKNPAECPFYGTATPPLTFFSAVTLMMSPDGGDSWTHARPPPGHLVAAQPYRWNQSLGRGPNFGFRSPSGVVEAKDGSGWFYATVTAGWGPNPRLGQLVGACMMRTRDLTDPGGWRAWGGAGYTVALGANPYTDPAIDPSEHVCVPFTDATYPSLLWSSHYTQVSCHCRLTYPLPRAVATPWVVSPPPASKLSVILRPSGPGRIFFGGAALRNLLI